MKRASNTAKIVVPAVLLAVWLLSLLVFWCVIGPSDALGYALISFYGLMPATVLGTSLAAGLLRPYETRSWLIIPVAAVLSMLLPSLTFLLANTLTFGNVNPPDLTALAFGAVVSLVGYGIGTGARALRALVAERKGEPR